MKIIKLFFNKFIIIALSLLVQLVLLFTLFHYLSQYYFIFHFLGAFIGILIFFHLVNRNESPEFKLPWIFIVLSLPVFGITLYVMLSDTKLTKKQEKLLSQILAKTTKYIEKTGEDKNNLDKYLGDYAGLENYLYNNSFCKGYLNNRVTYFNLGEKFYEDLLVELKKAKKFIFMEYFIIEKGKMWNSIIEILQEKVKEGVEVRVMYDDIGTFGKVRSGYYKKLRKMGIDCHKFNTFRPVITAVHNNRDHRKITVIDGKVGYTGGVNLADEYINARQRFGHWKDSAVKIEGSSVTSLTVLFLMLFDMNLRRISEYDKYLDIVHETFEDKGYVNLFGDGPKPFYRELVGENNFINMINSAKRSVYITTPYLIVDYNVTTALRNAAYRGVDVKIFTPHIPDKKLIFNMTRSNYRYLLSAGIKIYEYTPGFLHAKQMLVDDKLAFVGTINFDYRSFAHHYECGALLYNNPCIEDIQRDFEELINVSERIPPSGIKMSILSRFFNSILNLFSTML